MADHRRLPVNYNIFFHILLLEKMAEVGCRRYQGMKVGVDRMCWCRRVAPAIERQFDLDRLNKAGFYRSNYVPDIYLIIKENKYGINWISLPQPSNGVVGQIL